ncbi:helix-turn-helix transcriptional regulator [candidate division TA06 bacterium]|nr:helix-turn-helix transcriptional regulator [candidate division TA06 bacterium]
MLSFNFAKIFAARGIVKPVPYLIEQGLSPNYATKIAHSRFIRLDLPRLERLCIILNCTPNDLLEWTPSAKNKANPEHPLYPLKREEEKMIKLAQTINSLPIESLDEVQQAVESIKEKKKSAR